MENDNTYARSNQFNILFACYQRDCLRKSLQGVWIRMETPCGAI